MLTETDWHKFSPRMRAYGDNADKRVSYITNPDAPITAGCRAVMALALGAGPSHWLVTVKKVTAKTVTVEWDRTGGAVERYRLGAHRLERIVAKQTNY